MAERERKYTLDTNLFVRGFRDIAENDALDALHNAYAPFEYMTAVVAHELRVGARARVAARMLQINVLEPFERRGRVLTPSYAAWKLAAETLAALVRSEGLDLARVPRSFGNDVLLAATCREAGVVLVTENVRDFARIASQLPFDFVPPWPVPNR